MAKKRVNNFRIGYAEACKYAARDRSGTIDIRSLPEKYHRYHLQQTAKRRRYQKESFIKNLDSKIYLHKFYPWCYREFRPTLVLQGFYSIKFAKKKYLFTYGEDALKYVKFVKGRAALERGFSIGDTLHINGKWIQPASKIIRNPELNALNQTRSYRLKLVRGIKKGSSGYEEKQLEERINRLTYGRKPMKRILNNERDKLQKIQETHGKRKKDLYEE